VTGVTYACDASVIPFFLFFAKPKNWQRNSMTKKYDEMTGQPLGITAEVVKCDSGVWEIRLDLPDVAAIRIGKHAGAKGATVRQ